MRFSVLLLGIAVMLITGGPARAGYDDPDTSIMKAPAAAPPRHTSVRVELAGRPLQLKVAPVFREPFCMVPLHALLEALGCKGAFTFDRRSGKVHVEGFGTVAELQVGDGNLTVNGGASILDVPPFEHDGDVMVQIGKAAEITGVKMTWSKDRFTVSIASLPSPDDGRDLVKTTRTQQGVDEIGKGRRFALLVGVGNYASRDINALRFTLNDVAAIRRTLTDPAVGGYPAGQVRVLTDNAGPDLQPTKVNLEIGMNWLAAMASRPEDTVFIYFSGHGTSDGNGSYLITQETRPEALLSTALNIGDFNKMVNNIKARKKIVVLDACHSGGMDVASRGADKMSGQLKDQLLAANERAVGDVRFLSCKDDELSFEDDSPSVRQGIFSFYLVKGMAGEADADHDGLVTFPELDQYVTGKVVEWAALKGRRQTPTSDGKRSGTIIMSVVRK